MRFALALVPVLALLGCKDGASIDDTEETDTNEADTDTDTDSDSDTDTDTDTDSDTEAPCTAEIEDFDPIDDAANIGVDTSVTVFFSDDVQDGQWTLEIEDVAGTAVLAGDGKSATFTPDAPLDNDADYKIVATVCDDEDSANFSTVSGPIDPTDPVGRTYAMDYAEAEWVSPTVISYFSDQIAIEYILTQVNSFDDTNETLDASGALGGDDGTGDIGQLACYAPMDFSGADFSGNPTFVAGPQTLVVNAAGYDVTMEDFTIEGTFNSDASALLDINVTGLIDTRPLDSLGYGDICSLASMLGDECVACLDGEEECLFGWLIADEAPWVDGLDIDETYDPTTDPTCP